jgi:bifunctional DNA-binding transcriptional regulator/antitoxin component of YhaV-PrlF toxin-antitoxin module
MASKVGPRGQITIDKAIRERLGIKPRDVAVQEVVNGNVVVHFVPAPHRRSLKGILKARPSRPWKAWSEMQDIIEEAVAEDVMRRMQRER